MIFERIDDIQDIIPVSKTLEFSEIKPFLIDAERKYLLPVIGKETYDLINASYVGLNSDLRDLQKECRIPVAFIALKNWLPFGQVHITSDGIQISSNESRKTAFQWQVMSIEDSLVMQGFNAIDYLLYFLETNKAKYPTWASSSFATIKKDFFVSDVKEFNKINSLIGESRWNYLALQATMKDVEYFSIQKSLGVEFFTELKSQYKSDSLTSVNKIIYNLISEAIVNLTIATGIDDLSVLIDQRGVLLFNNSTSHGTIDNKQQINDKSIEKIKFACEGKGNKYLTEAFTWINSHLSDYPTYANSSTYSEGNSTIYKNDSTNNYYAALG